MNASDEIPATINTVMERVDVFELGFTLTHDHLLVGCPRAALDPYNITHAVPLDV